MVDLGSLEITESKYTYRHCIAQMQANIKACKHARKKADQALKDSDPVNTESFRQMANVCSRDANVWQARAAELQGG